MYLKFRRNNEKSEWINLTNEESKVIMIDIMSIRPNSTQPRKIFEDSGIVRLADSIKRYGIIHPLTVRKATSDLECANNYKYELISGERRLRAALMLGLTRVPCLVRSCSGLESAEMAIIENLLRHDLNFFEQAEAFSALISKFGLTQTQVAERLSTGQSSVANKLRLLRLTAAERQIILENRLTERHARALVRLNDEKMRLEVLEQVVKNRLNVSATELLVEKLLDPSSFPPDEDDITAKLTNPAGKADSTPQKHQFSSVEDIFEVFKRSISRTHGKALIECLDSKENDDNYVLTVRIKK